MSTINYLTVRNTIMPVVNAVTANYSTLRGSTLTGNALTTSTLATSTLTVSTMNFASTIISLGQSTNQTYNNFSNGSYLTWATPKSDMTTANKTVQSANGLYQMIIGNTTSGLFLSSDSGITWSTLTGGLPTLTGSAYWSDGAISANGQYITLSIYGGSLWMSADYGRTFALTNQPTPNIWLPLNGNTTDLMGSSTVTATGSPGYVTLNYPGYTAQAVSLANTAGGTATKYVRGTWTGSPNFTVSLWFNVQSLTSVYQNIFSAYAGAFIITIANNNTLYAQIPSGGASGISNMGFTSALTVNTWYYVTVIYQTNGLCSFYVNNVLIGSVTNSQGVGSYTPTQFSLGSYDTSTTQAFNGYVDDLRITNSVSTYVPIPLLQPNIWLPFENSAGDLGSYSLPPSATPTIYLPFEGNVTDSVGTSAPVATGPVTYVAANREGYTGQAIRLTNTSGGTAAQYVRGTWTSPSIYTVSGWFNLQSYTTPNNQFIFSTGGTSGGSAVLVYVNASNILVAQIPNSVTISSGTVVSLNTWYYFTLKIFPSGSSCFLYLNNSVYTATATATGAASGAFGLGTFDSTSQANAFNGLIDDFRIYNADVPYVPVSNVNITGSLSYVPGVVGLNAVNLVNPPGGTATNYIRGACSPMGSDITVCGWFNVQSFSANGFQIIFEMYNNAIEFYIDDANRRVNGRITLGTTSTDINTPISLNTWYHVCIIFRVNGACSFHLNGTLIQTVTNTAGYGTRPSTSLFSFGTYATLSTTNAFNGYICDFRIYNAAIPYHALFPQNYRSLALSGTGQYALASAASGWVVGSSNSSQTWSKQAVCVGTQSDFIQPNLSGLPVTATTWTQNGVTWTATESSNNGVTQSVSRAFNNTVSSDAWLSNNTTQRYTAGSPNGNAWSTNIQTIGATAGEWIQIQTSVPMVLANFAFGIGLNPFAFTNTPKTYYIVGSTDGTTWVPLQFGNFTISAWTSTSSNITMNITGTQPLNGNMVGSVATTAYPSYTPNAYSYFRLIGTSLMLTGPGGTYMEIGEWFLNFVLPLTNSRPPIHSLSMNHTGQYQLVATGPAAGSIMPNLTGLAGSTWTQGGVNWGVSASSVYLTLYPYGAFNTVNSAVGSYSWASNMGTYSATTPFACTSGVSTTILGGVGATTGEWLQLQSSVPLVIQSYTYGCAGSPNIPQRYYIVGSNDGSTWYPIQLAVMTTSPFTANFQLATTNIIVNQSGTQTITGAQTGSGSFTTYATTTNAYTYFRIIITNLYGNSTITEIGEWYINFSNSVSYSANYGSTWLNTSQTVSNESVALSSSGQYALSTNSVAPFARLTLDNTNVDTYGILVPATGLGTVTYSTSIKTVGTHSAFFNNTAGAAPSMYLNYTLPVALNTPSALTMACWVYPTSYPTSNRATIVSLYNAATNAHGSEMSIQTTGLVSANFFGQGNINGNAIFSTSSVPLNSWTHIAMTYQAGIGTLFVNGVSISSITTSGNLVMYNGSPTVNLIVGAIHTAAYSYAGYVDDVRIYTSALSATAISTLYNNPTIMQSQIVAVSNSYLPITSYTFPALSGIGTANIVDSAVSQTGQYMVAVTSSTTNNVYYSTDYGATFTALTVGSLAMVSCSISYDGSYLTVESATTVHTLNRNTRGFSVTVGNQAGLINQAQNAIAIGNQAGRTNQSANSIVLNATGNALDAVAPGFYVSPVATAASSSAAPFNLLGYGTDNQIVQSSALTVLQNGNVGIGTVAPNFPLDIFGGAVSITSSGYTPYLRLQSVFGAAYLSIGSVFGVNTYIGLQCGVTTTSALGTPPFVVTNAGTVGIGTQNPEAGYAMTIRATAASLTGNLSCYKDGNFILAIYTGGTPSFAGWNNANTVLYVARDTGTGRSVNVAGTFNASGTDYAEYMVKNGDFIISKGDIVGIDKSGLLTNQYDDAVTFVVKSTDPSYVGGDSWGTEETLGAKPKEPESSASEEEKAVYQAAKATWEAALEVERQRVDRIAFSGRVPVNVVGAQPGDYIVPTRNVNGTIGGQVVTDANITFSEYKKAVGKVIDILLDGRASIIVKVC